MPCMYIYIYGGCIIAGWDHQLLGASTGPRSTEGASPRRKCLGAPLSVVGAKYSGRFTIAHIYLRIYILYVYTCTPTHACIHVYIYTDVYTYIHIYIHLSTFPSINLPVRLSIHLSPSRSLYLSTHLCVCLSKYACVYLCTYVGICNTHAHAPQIRPQSIQSRITWL